MSAEPLRALVVAARCLPNMGGIEMHVQEVSRRLAKAGDFEMTVLATDRTRSRPRQEVIEGVTVLRVPARPSNQDYYLVQGATGFVGKPGSWDILHCQGIHTPVPLLAMLSASCAGTPYMVTFHAALPELPTWDACAPELGQLYLAAAGREPTVVEAG